MYPFDLSDHIRKDVAAVGRMLVVLDDDPTGTQTVHSVPVLAEWSVDILAKEVRVCVFAGGRGVGVPVHVPAETCVRRFLRTTTRRECCACCYEPGVPVPSTPEY